MQPPSRSLRALTPAACMRAVDTEAAVVAAPAVDVEGVRSLAQRLGASGTRVRPYFPLQPQGSS